MIGSIVPGKPIAMPPPNAVPAGDLLYFQPKRKVAAGLAAALGMTAVSWWLALGGNPFGRPAAVLFGLCAIALLAMLVHPRAAGLRVADDGFETLALMGGRFYPWDAVRSISATQLMGATVLGVELDADRFDVGRTGRYYAKLHGFHLPLMDTYGAPLGEIQAAMQQRRDAYHVRRAVAAAGR